MSDQRGRYHISPTPELRDELARREELRLHARNFLLAGGLMAGHSDGELVDEEQDTLIEALASLCRDPAGEIERLDSPEVALDLLQGSMTWLAEHGGELRLELYIHLAAIVAADGRFDPGEAAYMQNVAQGLGIPLDEAHEIIKRELSGPSDSA